MTDFVNWHAVGWAALLTYLAWPRVLEFGRGLRDGWQEADREIADRNRRDR